MKRVAFLVTFTDLDPCYSLTSVFKAQVRPLVAAGYRLRVIGPEGFDGQLGPAVDWRGVLPRVRLTDYQPGVALGADFEDQVDLLADALDGQLEGIDVCITHDVMFQTWFLPLNAAVRRIAERHPGLRWLHWMHSAPSARPHSLVYPHTLRYSKMPNARIVFLNHRDVPRVAAMVGVDVADVAVVYNPVDARRFFGLDPATDDFVTRHRLLDASLMVVYPTRLSPGKQIEFAIKLVASAKPLARPVRLVVCDAYSEGQAEQDYIDRLLALAGAWGLDAGELLFTSRDHHQGAGGVDPDTVRCLLQLSHVFILPSLSEACSLVLLEAALSRNLLVLNEDFPPVREFAGDNALYFKFSSTVAKTTYASEAGYLSICARKMVDHIRGSPLLAQFDHVKRRFNEDHLFQTQLRPLIEN